MAVLQPLTDLVQLCQEHGICRAVVSPGSRSAALTLAFARNHSIECTVVMDERAAGFVAMGMAQQLQMPVALVCTSGSAAYNFAPAIAEAFFQQIPLLIFTADRPAEWIHQNDGQTIYQTNLYGRHVKETYTLPADYNHPDSVWFINRAVNEAILTSKEYPKGPVHINVPIREPFYPKGEEKIIPSSNIRTIKKINNEVKLDINTWHHIQDEWENSERILIAVGQHLPDKKLIESIKKIAEEFQIPILGDVISNLPDFESKISKHDIFLGDFQLPILQPDLLITIGQSFISKQFKQFIRKNPPRKHWYIGLDNHLIDTFQTLTDHIPVQPEYFFSTLFEDLDFQRFVQHEPESQDESYLEEWLKLERGSKRNLRDYLRNLTMFNELTALEYVLSQLDKSSQLHIANSMPIRYTNLLGIESEEITVYCNRGTSGIDGCVSTAIGSAFIVSATVYLLVGDVAFFYDRNGLLLDNLPSNLKIILLNNAGGTIFRLIDGPSNQPELEKYFETKHNFTARRTAEDSGIEYALVETMKRLPEAWKQINNSTKTALLEIKTDPLQNAEIYKELKLFLKNKF